MTYLFLILIILSNIICCIIKRKSRLIVFFSSLIFSLILGGSNNNPDYKAYELNYRLAQTDDSYFNFDYLWGPFMKVGGLLNLTYNEFLFIFSFIAYFILFSCLSQKLYYNIHKIILFYVVYSFFIDVIQVANFFANVLAVIAIIKIFDYRDSGNKKNLIAFLILLLCSLGFHNSVIVFFPLLLVNYLIKIFKCFKINTLIFFSISLALINVVLKNIIFVKLLSVIPYGNYYEAFSYYGENSRTGFGFMIHVFIIWVMLQIANKTNKNSNVVFFMHYLLIMTPLLSFSTITFVRIMRAVMLYYGTIYNPIDNIGKKARLITNIILLIVLSYLISTDITIDNFYQIMDNNMFI